MGFLLHSCKSMEALETISRHSIFSKTLKHIYISVARIRRPGFETFRLQRERFHLKRETRKDVKQAYDECVLAYKKNEAWVIDSNCYRLLRTTLSDIRKCGNPVSLAFEMLVPSTPYPASRSFERHGRPSQLCMQKSTERELGHYGTLTDRPYSYGPYYSDSVHSEILEPVFDLCSAVKSLSLGCMSASLSWNALYEARLSTAQIEASTRWLTSLDLGIGRLDSRRDASLPFVSSIRQLLECVRNNNRLESLQIALQFRVGYETGAHELRNIIANMAFPALKNVCLIDMCLTMIDIERILSNHRKSLQQARFHGIMNPSHPFDRAELMRQLEQQQRDKIGRSDLNLSIRESA